MLLIPSFLLLHSLTRRLPRRLLELDPNLRLVLLVVVARERQGVVVEELAQAILLYFAEDVRAIHALDSEVEVAHEEHVLVVDDGHAPLPKVLLKGRIKDLHELLRPLVVLAAAGGQVAVDDHEALPRNFKTDAHSSLVAADARGTGLDSAALEGLRRDLFGEALFMEDGEVAADHLLVGVLELVVVELLLKICAPQMIPLIYGLHHLDEPPPPLLQLFLIGYHYIFRIQTNHLLQRYNIHVGHVAHNLILEGGTHVLGVLNLKNGQELLPGVGLLSAAIQGGAVDVYVVTIHCTLLAVAHVALLEGASYLGVVLHPHTLIIHKILLLLVLPDVELDWLLVLIWLGTGEAPLPNTMPPKILVRYRIHFSKNIRPIILIDIFNEK